MGDASILQPCWGRPIGWGSRGEVVDGRQSVWSARSISTNLADRVCTIWRAARESDVSHSATCGVRPPTKKSETYRSILTLRPCELGSAAGDCAWLLLPPPMVLFFSATLFTICHESLANQRVSRAAQHTPPTKPCALPTPPLTVTNVRRFRTCRTARTFPPS